MIKDALNPETPEVLAASIIGIEKSLKELRASGLTDEGIAVLVNGMIGGPRINKGDVLLVLNGLARLRSYYVNK